jgi:hypothetical protein
MAGELLAELAPQVRANCLRADAAVAGHFSLCGLLLRLRNLYKWEQGLPPWREEDPAVVLEWVDAREELWEAAEAEPRPLILAGQSFDAFDAEGVNRLLAPEGLVYGAGLAGGLAPVFFLGRVRRSLVHHGLEVTEVDREEGKDILFLPGLRHDNQVFLRAEPMAYLVWDKVADPRPSQARFVDFGLAGYGLSRGRLLAEPSWEALAPVLEGELSAVLWHEAGEAAAGEEASRLLARAVAEHPLTELEHFARGVKDLLADTAPGGRLAGITAARAAGALGFYPAWLYGFPRLMLPEVDAAVMAFMRSGDWQEIEEVRLLGLERATEALRALAPLLALGPGEATRERARREVIEPLTGGRGLPAGEA